MRFLWLFVAAFVPIFAGDDGLDGRESTIPVLDLQDYFNRETKDAFIESVKEASHKVGFFALKNTGVNQEVIDNLYKGLEEFFACDMDSKNLVSAAPTGGQRGYTSFNKEKAKGEAVSDVKEFLHDGARAF